MFKSQVQTSSPEFKKNQKYHQGLIEKLRKVEAQAVEGGLKRASGTRNGASCLSEIACRGCSTRDRRFWSLGGSPRTRCIKTMRQARAS